ncbi:MAG: hypothetical protein O8C59_06130 [Candidatus Methanoperedens sp.]|nr:hypothetical protein [Candidatus Methanoperedens sp.]
MEKLKKILLTDLLSNHKEKFRQKLIEALAKKNSLTPDQVIDEHSDFIEQYVADKYENVEQLINRINQARYPVLLNIRRDRAREDTCKLCEGNQPNIDEISKKYGDRIELIEMYEDKPEGGSLYNIIFHEDAPEKKLPLTAVISRGEILKFWAGKTVESAVYERYLKKASQLEAIKKGGTVSSAEFEKKF